MEDIRFRIGKAVRMKRHKPRVSQEEFVDIGGIERGERNVALVNIEKIAKALHIPITQLFRNV